MGFLKTSRTFLEMIKFSHSVFALPFALTATLVAAGGWPDLRTVLLIVLAVVSARTAAMCFNRLADRRFDKENPRTASRALVTGELSPAFAWGAMALSVGLFLLAAGLLNALCLALAPLCLFVLLGYSYTKRFTSASHLWLGAALGLAPVGAWIAVTGSLEGLGFPLALGLGVVLWVAGFDILYSCQDYEHDRATAGLHSMPKRLGIAGAMQFGRRLHGLCLLAFVLAWWLGRPPLGLLFLAGLAGVALLLRWEHSLVSPRDLSRINAAFFTLNGVISVGLFLVAWGDVVAL